MTGRMSVVPTVVGTKPPDVATKIEVEEVAKSFIVYSSAVRARARGRRPARTDDRWLHMPCMLQPYWTLQMSPVRPEERA